MATFIVLTLAIAWGGMLFILGVPDGIPADENEIVRLMIPAYIALLACPSVAGVALTALLGGKAGPQELAARLRRWRVGGRWYAAALFTAPLITLATLLALSLASDDFWPRIFTEADPAFLVFFSLVSALIVGVFAEIGFTGFAVPRLRQRHGVPATGLIVGAVQGLWQFPVVYWAGGGTSGSLPPAIFLAAVLFTWLPTYRVLMVWVYNQTESALVAMVMHTSLFTFWTMLTPLTITGAALLIYYLVITAALWAVIAAIAMANHGRLSRPPILPRMA